MDALAKELWHSWLQYGTLNWSHFLGLTSGYLLGWLNFLKFNFPNNSIQIGILCHNFKSSEFNYLNAINWVMRQQKQKSLLLISHMFEQCKVSSYYSLESILCFAYIDETLRIDISIFFLSQVILIISWSKMSFFEDWL